MEDASTERLYSSGEESYYEEEEFRNNSQAAPHYRRQYEIPRKIHIMGIGSVGKFMAHSLRGIDRPPPIILITHKPETRARWRDSNRVIRCITKGDAVGRGTFRFQVAIPNPRFHKQEVLPHMPFPLDSKSVAQQEGAYQVTPEEFAAREQSPEPEPGSWKTTSNNAESGDELPEYPDIDEDGRELQNSHNEMIWNLILTVKATDVVSALSALQHRLDKDSTILFLHNGIGVIDEVNEHIFPDPKKRPNYLLGVNSHGVKSAHIFEVEHAGFGTLAIGPYPHLSFDKASPGPLPFQRILNKSSHYLMRTIVRTPVLTAAIFPPESLLAIQLEKLAINAVINPLTALLDVRNGALPYAYPILRTSRLLIAEVSMVLRHLPALAHLPNTSDKFSPQRLENLWVSVAHKTAQNVSSMLADVRIGRRTEIEYINGWVVKMGEKLGTTCVTNYATMQMVRGKQLIVGWEQKGEVPFYESPSMVVKDPEMGGVVAMKREEGSVEGAMAEMGVRGEIVHDRGDEAENERLVQERLDEERRRVVADAQAKQSSEESSKTGFNNTSDADVGQR